MKRSLSVARMIGCMMASNALVAACAWAQIGGSGPGPATTQPRDLVQQVVSTLVFGIIGIVLAILGFKLFDAVIHFDLAREICEKQNIAVAILCAGMLMGISLIVAAAVL